MTYGKSIMGAGYPLSLTRSAAMRVGSMMQGLWQTLKLWRRRTHERGALGQFDRRDMQDLGLSSSDIQREIGKPFWRN
jgi:uncharacterized protein YjiS (DUF1127 family)